MAPSTERQSRPAAAVWMAAGLLAVGAAGTPGAAGAADIPAQPFYGNHFEKTPTAAALTALGQALFVDASLSSSGKTACATCHVPSLAFGPPNGAAVQRAGRTGSSSGVRAVPALTYAQNVPSFTEHYFDDDGDDSIDQGPAGGRTWDGRAQSAHEQAALPLLSPFEMANDSVASLVSRMERGSHAAQIEATFGNGIFSNAATAFRAIQLALETYQQSPEFYPYSSKYDAWLRRQTTLSAQEQRGLAAFNDPRRGNCARCHPSAVRGGAFPPFTDFGYAALGVPRNADIPANADRHYVDLGLCGPLRTDLADRPEYCGMFRTPSLRNTALRHVFFHNGVVHDLAGAVRFYAERDTQPGNWYPRSAGGEVQQYDDLPARYLANLDREAPFGARVTPLGAADVADIVAFLQTLTDGWTQ